MPKECLKIRAWDKSISIGLYVKYLWKSHEGQKQTKICEINYQIPTNSITKLKKNLAFINILSLRINVYFAKDFSNFPLTNVFWGRCFAI